MYNYNGLLGDHRPQSCNPLYNRGDLAFIAIPPTPTRSIEAGRRPSPTPPPPSGPLRARRPRPSAPPSSAPASSAPPCTADVGPAPSRARRRRPSSSPPAPASSPAQAHHPEVSSVRGRPSVRRRASPPPPPPSLPSSRSTAARALRRLCAPSEPLNEFAISRAHSPYKPHSKRAPDGRFQTTPASHRRPHRCVAYQPPDRSKGPDLSQAESTSQVPVNSGVFAKEPLWFSKINPPSKPFKKIIPV